MSAEDIRSCDWSALNPPRTPGWVLVDPDGAVEAIIGGINRPISTAEDAHKRFTPLKRDRQRELAEGWPVRREQAGDQEALVALVHKEVEGK